MSVFKVGDKVCPTTLMYFNGSARIYGEVVKSSKLFYGHYVYHVHFKDDAKEVWFPFSEEELEHE